MLAKEVWSMTNPQPTFRVHFRFVVPGALANDSIFATVVNLPSWAKGDEFFDTANPPIAKHDIIE